MSERTVVKNNTTGGIGFIGLLQIAFIVLKLTGFITWSWFWVLSPIWISVLIWVLVIAIIIVVAAKMERKEREWRRRRPY